MNREKIAANDLTVATEVATTEQPQLVSGLSKEANLENYITDLQDLAYQIYRYEDLCERSNLEDEPERLALLQRITRSVKNLAVIYTDCISEAFDQLNKTQNNVKIKLNQYPEAIADLQRKLLKTDQRIRQLAESVAILTAAIERQIAFDVSLKNDSQRKARRVELMESDGDYISASIALKAAQDRRESLLIELQLLRNQFSVLKLDMREAIAVKELAAFDAA
jgi:chromosome segregation ATPase